MGYPVKDRIETIQQLAAGRRVLHLGCTNWPYTAEAIASGTLLHHQLSLHAAVLVGLDADREGIDRLEQIGLGPIVWGDVEDLESVRDHPQLTGGFELIVAAEIVEHLPNPGKLLAGLRPLLADGGRVVVTTINAFGAVRIAPYALRGHGGKNEPVHPDHVAYYSPSTLRVLLTKAGFVVDWLAFYRLGKEHRPHCSWWIRLANDAATRFAPQLSDGVIALCRPLQVEA